ncbi:MAG: hypothetical protein DMF23_00280 [Verrucomicrobia bacterium]|nr:MAG: hypothetical protein DMF23_00280 [Verrucomicrobiota bacterium]
MKTRIARHVAIYLFIALSGYGIGACRQNVTLNPSEDDLLVLNGCVVSACNYLAAIKTQHTLEKNFWAKILLVRYANHPAGHAYCVWETDGTVYGYDRNAGGFLIPVYTRDAFQQGRAASFRFPPPLALPSLLVEERGLRCGESCVTIAPAADCFNQSSFPCCYPNWSLGTRLRNGPLP